MTILQVMTSFRQQVDLMLKAWYHDGTGLVLVQMDEATYVDDKGYMIEAHRLDRLDSMFNAFQVNRQALWKRNAFDIDWKQVRLR